MRKKMTYKRAWLDKKNAVVTEYGCLYVGKQQWTSPIRKSYAMRILEKFNKEAEHEPEQNQR